MSSKLVKGLGLIGMIGLAGFTFLNEFVRDKKIHEEIVKEVAKAVANK